MPKWAAYRPATVKAYVDRVELLQDGKLVASHHRSYEKDRWVVDPLHYVAALSTRPHAIDHSNVFRHWSLPATFGELRSRMEREHGRNAGVQQYIRVLQLLTTHPATRVEAAIRRLWHRVHLRAEFIKAKANEIASGAASGAAASTLTVVGSARPTTERSPARKSEAPSTPPMVRPHAGIGIAHLGVVKNDATTGARGDRSGTDGASSDERSGAGPPILVHPLVHVPRPDLKRFNRLLSSYPQGASTHE